MATGQLPLPGLEGPSPRPTRQANRSRAWVIYRRDRISGRFAGTKRRIVHLTGECGEPDCQPWSESLDDWRDRLADAITRFLSLLPPYSHSPWH